MPTVAEDVLALARAGIPFAEARAMGEDERQSYLAALALPCPVPVTPEASVLGETEPEATGLSFIA